MVQNPQDIRYFNRKNNQLEIEKVYGDAAVKAMYQSLPGKMLAPILSHRLISKVYGSTQDLGVSRYKVPKFVENFSINMDEYEPGSVKSNDQNLSYASFNEFFIRRFRAGRREFVSETKLAAPAEARYFGWEKITDDLKVPVKGQYLRPADLVNTQKYPEFNNGPLFIARLCPVDYHRYHYPDNGMTLEAYPVQGEYQSVNPIALKYKGDIFIKNERRVAILDTENFGKLAYIEVGAICVGKIVQSFDESQKFSRGDEKGHFLFGGSTVIVIGEEGRWRPSQDMLSNTRKGIETYIQLGDEVGEF